MALDFGNTNAENTRAALTVSALNRAVSGLLQRSFPLVRVRGEIANVTRAASGHWYFALKDDQAQARCVMFRARNQLLGLDPRDGDEVEVSAVVSLYEARGEFQLSVESMRRAGQGQLFEEFMQAQSPAGGRGTVCRRAQAIAAARTASGGSGDVDAGGCVIRRRHSAVSSRPLCWCHHLPGAGARRGCGRSYRCNAEESIQARNP